MKVPTEEQIDEVESDIMQLCYVDEDLRAVVYELGRALQSDWPEDIPRFVSELLPILESYRHSVQLLIEDVEKVFKQEEPEEISQKAANS
jgi:hypothetical protein